MGTLEKIIQLLEIKEKNQKDLTDYLGLGKNTFSNWKAGHNHSYLKYINQISAFLGVSTDYLLGTHSSDAEVLAGILKIDADLLTEDKINEIARYAEFVTKEKNS